MNPEDGYICYIVNPKSGSKGNRSLSGEFEAYLERKGFYVRTEVSESITHVCELATDAAVDFNCALVVVVGGDGTVREAAHGLEGSDKPMMIIPTGTENLLANELGYKRRIENVIETFENGQVRVIDLGSANDKCFTSVVGFGFDGEIVSVVSRQRKGHITHADYFLPIWRTFWKHKFPAMKVEVDGNVVFEGRGLTLVGNISRYAIGLQILKNAQINDGKLDICIYQCTSRLHLLKHAIFTLLKWHVGKSDVIYCQGESVTVTSMNNDIKTEIDGDPGPDLPVDIKIIPHTINILTPMDAKPLGIRDRFLRFFK